MKLLSFISIVLIFFLSLQNFAVAEEEKSNKNLNQIMSQIGSTMVELFPVVFSKNILTDTQNRKVHKSVRRLQLLFRQAEPFILEKSPTYHMSYQILQDYLDSIITADNPVFLPQIKYRLETLSDFCVSCHTQDNKFRTLFSGVKSPKLASNLAYAEFNYATRNYLIAKDYYEKHLLLSRNLVDSDVLKTLHRLLSIYIQILNKPQDILPLVDKLKSNSIFSKDIQRYLDGVSNTLETHITEKLYENDVVSFRELQKFVTQYLGDSNFQQPFIISTPKIEMDRLWLRGLLFRYLNAGPKTDEMPQLLYWLALCDRSLGYGYDYALADFYIKQCITRYSSHPFARRCFSEYKSFVKFYFTSPTEPVIPIEIDRELKALEKYLP